MNRKTIIQIAVIVICFGAAGLLLFNSFFKGGSVSEAPVAPPGAQMGTLQDNSKNPLPFGDDLSGQLKKVLGKSNLQYGLFNYPKFNEAEVGIPPSDLVKPLPADQ